MGSFKKLHQTKLSAKAPKLLCTFQGYKVHCEPNLLNIYYLYKIIIIRER